MQGDAKRSVSEFQKQEPASVRTLNQKGGAPSPLPDTSEFAGVAWAGAEFRVSRDPQTRGTEGSQVTAPRVTKRETHVALRQLHRRLSASGCGKLRSPAVKRRGRPGEAETSCQLAGLEGKPVCLAAWEGEAGPRGQTI